MGKKIQASEYSKYNKFIKDEPMTLKKANDILQNPKDHWSHEIDESREYVIKAVDILCTDPDLSKMVDNDGCRITERIFTTDHLIYFLDKKIARYKEDHSGRICGNCKFYDPGWLRCQNENVARTIRQPLEDACFCYKYCKEETT